MSGSYIVRRLLLLPVTVLGASLLVFVVMRVIPGDVAEVILGSTGSRYTPEQLEELRKELGTSDPLPLQYGHWLRGVLTGDLGKSLVTGRSVNAELKGRIPVTAELAIMAALIGNSIGVLAGIASAVGRNHPWAKVIDVVGILGLALPGFWIGTLIILLLVSQFGWLPRATYVSIAENPRENLTQFIWPALTLSVATAAYVMRVTRSSMLEVIKQDYIRTARAKGLKSRDIALHHGLTNALLPLVTLLALQAGTLLGGAVVIEQVFNLAGVGTLLTQSVSSRDYPVVQAIVIYVSLVYVLIWFAMDIVYASIDPRIRLK